MPSETLHVASFLVHVRPANLRDVADWLADRWAHVVPWVRPVWMEPWAFVAAATAALVAVGWTAGDIVYHRGWVRARLGGLLGRARTRLSGGDRTPGDD
jgi:hypothetical protein